MAKRKIDERTSGRDDAGTPAWLIDRIVKYRPIGLDPAGGSKALPSSKAAKIVYRLPHNDGLIEPWRGRGLVFCNPPYGRLVKLWIKKAIAAFSPAAIADVLTDDRDDELLLLIAARVDTAWFRLIERHCDAYLRFRSRINFIGELHGAKFPSALIYFGHHAEAFHSEFADLGTVTVFPERANHAIDDDAVCRNARIYFPVAITRARANAKRSKHRAGGVVHVRRRRDSGHRRGGDGAQNADRRP
jgi:hypothetical protein